MEELRIMEVNFYQIFSRVHLINYRNTFWITLRKTMMIPCRSTVVFRFQVYKNKNTIKIPFNDNKCYKLLITNEEKACPQLSILAILLELAIVSIIETKLLKLMSCKLRILQVHQWKKCLLRRNLRSLSWSGLKKKNKTLKSMLKLKI